MGKKKKQNKTSQLFSHIPGPTLTIQQISRDIHPKIHELGIKYQNRQILGSTARCIAMLLAFREAVGDYTGPGVGDNLVIKFDLEKKIKFWFNYLTDCRSHCISMGNAMKFLRTRLRHLSSQITIEDAKDTLIESINEFIDLRIVGSMDDISSKAANKINNNDVILTYLRSHLIEKVLLTAKIDHNKNFRVIIVDSRPNLEGQKMLKNLTDADIQCTYVHFNALSYIMRETTKIFLGCSGFLSNGSALARAGTANIALVGKSFNIPVIFCCESYKFSNKVQIDAIVHNELGKDINFLKQSQNYENMYKFSNLQHSLQSFEPINIKDNKKIDNNNNNNNNQNQNQNKNNKIQNKNEKNLHQLDTLNIIYDLTPGSYVSIIITEAGMIPPTSVPVLIRETEAEEERKREENEELKIKDDKNNVNNNENNEIKNDNENIINS